jgi:hypothetical protein
MCSSGHGGRHGRIRFRERALRDGKLLLRGAMRVLATGVAAIAAVVSYSHIYDLGRRTGRSS